MAKVKIDDVFDTFRGIAGELKTSGADLTKFKEGNKAAGTRLRKKLLTIRGLCNDGRKEIQSIKNQ